MPPLLKVFVFKEPKYTFPMEEITGGQLTGSVQGVLVGDVKLVSGKQGRALYLNGLDQRVSLGNQRHNCMGDLNKCINGFVVALWMIPTWHINILLDYVYSRQNTFETRCSDLNTQARTPGEKRAIHDISTPAAA